MSFSSTCALGLLKMKCYGLLFGGVQPFPYKWGNLHLFLLFFLVYLKAENISLYFCFTAYFSELLFVLLVTIGDSTVFLPQETPAALFRFKNFIILNQTLCLNTNAVSVLFCKVWFSCEINHRNTMTETCLTLPSSKTTGRDW